MNENTQKKLTVIDIGRQPYVPVWELQKQLHQQRIKGEIPDTLLFLEHEHVYTIGKNGTEMHVIATREFLEKRGVEVVKVDRGGDVTYHGPGQLVGYPIFDLHEHRQSVSWYMRSLEEIFIRLLQKYDIPAERVPDYTGVWVGDQKIVALGVRISRWVTMHGFALNVNTDLSYYDGIIPCGIFHRGVTSMQEVLKKPLDLKIIKREVVEIFQEVFGFTDVEIRKNPQWTIPFMKEMILNEL